MNRISSGFTAAFANESDFKRNDHKIRFAIKNMVIVSLMTAPGNNDKLQTINFFTYFRYQYRANVNICTALIEIIVIVNQSNIAKPVK